MPSACDIQQLLHCSQLQPTGQGAADEGPARQGSYLQRHTSSLILKMAQDAAVPPLPAVANLVCCHPPTHPPVQIVSTDFGPDTPILLSSYDTLMSWLVMLTSALQT